MQEACEIVFHWGSKHSRKACLCIPFSKSMGLHGLLWLLRSLFKWNKILCVENMFMCVHVSACICTYVFICNIYNTCTYYILNPFLYAKSSKWCIHISKGTAGCTVGGSPSDAPPLCKKPSLQKRPLLPVPFAASTDNLFIFPYLFTTLQIFI